MTSPQRDVRPTQDFYRDLERQLSDQRGPHGEPSRIDFQTYDLLMILTRFATGWDGLPPLVRGREDYRVLISAGVLVRALVVEGQLARDGVIELVSLRIDTSWPEDEEDPSD